MKKYFTVVLILASLLVVALAAISSIGRTVNDLPAAPVIGTLIDEFKLPDFDGKEHSLNSLKGAKGTVLIFIATKCPVSNAYNDRVEQLAEAYNSNGVDVIGINSDHSEMA